MTRDLLKRQFVILLLLTIFAAQIGILIPANAYNSSSTADAPLSITISPSSVTIKVGDKATINVTTILQAGAGTGQVCFEIQGFPDTGFRTSFSPQCATSQGGSAGTVLTVEVTPASAPQTVDAFVVARSGSQIAQANLSVTVEPAMSPWVPWLGLLLFFVILGIAIAWRPKLFGKKAARSASKVKSNNTFSRRT